MDLYCSTLGLEMRFPVSGLTNSNFFVLTGDEIQCHGYPLSGILWVDLIYITNYTF